MQIIVHEVLFDHIALVAKADDKIIIPILTIHFHDMPENWLTSDLDHRLRTDFSFFADPCTQTARKNDNFHILNWRGKSIAKRGESNKE